MDHLSVTDATPSASEASAWIWMEIGRVGYNFFGVYGPVAKLAGVSHRVTVIVLTAVFFVAPFVSVATTYQLMLPVRTMLSTVLTVLMKLVQMPLLGLNSRDVQDVAPGFLKSRRRLFTPST